MVEVIPFYNFDDSTVLVMVEVVGLWCGGRSTIPIVVVVGLPSSSTMVFVCYLHNSNVGTVVVVVQSLSSL